MDEQPKQREVSRRIFGQKPMPFGLFVTLSRMAVNTMKISSFCGLRRCGRRGHCVGKLTRREIPGELGGGNDFAAWLPLCIAGADDLWLLGFIDYWYFCRDEHFDRPIQPPQAEPDIPPLYEEWPHADHDQPEALPSFLDPSG